MCELELELELELEPVSSFCVEALYLVRRDGTPKEFEWKGTC